MAQTLKFGNGTWATKKGSTLAYNDEDGNFKPLPFAYTGAGKGTRVNKEGLIEVVENDRPRIDYKDSAEGVLLLENASTNRVTYSEDFSNAAWSKINITVEANSTISPDGTLNASKVLEQVNSANGHFMFDDLGLTPSVEYNFSIFVKKLNRRYVALQNSYNTANGSIAFFDLDTETLVYTYSNGTVGSFIVSDAKIEKYPNGWYRLSANFQSSVTPGLLPSLVLADTQWSTGFSYNNLYTGDITKGIYIWGAQVEQGSYPTSYIPTQGAASTRSAETASGSGNSEVFNSEQGVLFFEGSALANDLTNRFISLTDGSNDNRVLFGYRAASNQIFARIEGNNSASVDLTTVSSDTKINAKITISYDSSYNYKMFVNGFLVDSGVGTDSIIGLDRLDFTNASGTENFYGKTKEIGYYDEILTDLELETLTSYRTWESMVKELNLNVIYNG